MLPISGREPVRFTPDHYRNEDGVVPEEAPAYLVDVPTLRGKAEFNRACVAAGLMTHDRATIIATLRQGVADQIEERQAGPLIDMLDRLAAASTDDPPDERDVHDFTLLHDDMRRHWPRFAEMVADGIKYQQMAPVIAAQVFLAGWEGIELAFGRRHGLVPEHLLARLPEKDVIAVGMKALELFAPSEEQAKNSGSRSPSRGGRASSPARLRKATPGKSAASDTSTTQPDGSARTTG